MEYGNFTNTELVGIHLIYGFAEGNAGKILYREKYPQRDAPDRRIFNILHHIFCKHGSLRGNRYNEGGPGVIRTYSFEQNILNIV